MTTIQNIEKFWSICGAFTTARAANDRRAAPAPAPAPAPVVHPLFPTNPITGKRVLYCNPGFAERINELPERESDEILEYLFEHQLKPQFCWTNVWAENDVLVWDHLGTLHRALVDYGSDEI